MKTRKRAFFLLKIVVSIALVCLIVGNIGIAELAASLKSMNLYFVPALLGALLFTYLKVLKWHFLLLAAAGKGVPRSEAAKSYLVGLACGLVTPARVGELARMIFLEDYDRSLIAYLVVVDRLLDLVVVLFLAVPGLLYFSHPAVAAAMGGLAVIMLLIILFPALPLRCLQYALERSGKFAAAGKQLASVATRIQAVSLLEKWRLLGISFLSYGIAIAQFYSLLNNYHHGGPGMSLLVHPLVMLTNILPFAIAGLGFREGTAMVLLARFAVPRAAAVSTAFMLFLLDLALPALAGAVLLIIRRAKRAGR